MDTQRTKTEGRGEPATLCIIRAVMENRTDRLAKQTLRILPGVVLAVAAGIFFLDDTVAFAIDRILDSSPLRGRYASDIPDLLLPFVLVLSPSLLAVRYLRIGRGRRDEISEFCLLGAAVLPFSFLAKTAFKLLFGRIETRVWLKAPVPPGLQWFRPGEGHEGFPSGHMTVFVSLAAACWIFFPRLRKVLLSFLLLLGAALIGTNYHFVSDVIAGAYLGLAVAAATAILLEKSSVGRMP